MPLPTAVVNAESELIASVADPLERDAGKRHIEHHAAFAPCFPGHHFQPVDHAKPACILDPFEQRVSWIRGS
jgi:hypothetical protein